MEVRHVKRLLTLLLFLIGSSVGFAEEPITINVWPGKPPGETKELGPEADQTKPQDKLIAGRRIIKLGNVATPQITVYRPSKAKDTGTSVVICPGGGHYILAYDLEGTEVATWLNDFGVTGIVLKYRVPFRDPEKRWQAAVQDAQRAMSLVRSHAAEWKLDPKRIGMLGFSAGGQVAGLVSIFNDERQYEPLDDIDKVSSRPDFAVLVYPGGLDERGQPRLRPEVKVTKESPPMFFVHAFDDNASVFNTLLLATELKKVGVSAEVHVYATGGHGYGLTACGWTTRNRLDQALRSLDEDDGVRPMTTAPTKPGTVADPAYDVLRSERGSLESFFSPRNVALIGATEKPGSVGRTVLWNLISNPFGGVVFPINPNRSHVLGMKAYPKLADVPDPVELAIIVTPAPSVPALIAECVEQGVKAAIVISAGFKEIGEAGTALERQILRVHAHRKNPCHRAELPGGHEASIGLERHVRRSDGPAGQRRFHQPEWRPCVRPSSTGAFANKSGSAHSFRSVRCSTWIGET